MKRKRKKQQYVVCYDLYLSDGTAARTYDAVSERGALLMFRADMGNNYKVNWCKKWSRV